MLSVVTLTCAGLLTFNYASAREGKTPHTQRGTAMHMINKDQIKKVIELIHAGDFNAWSSYMSSTEVQDMLSKNPKLSELISKITAENFSLLQEAIKLQESMKPTTESEIVDKETIHAFRISMKDMTEDQRKALNTALENKDYQAWKNLLPASLQDKASQSWFDYLVKMQSSQKRLQEIASQLGFDTKNIMPFGFSGKKMDIIKHKMPFANLENKEALNAAMQSKDYATWKSLMPENHPLLEKITESNFSLFVDMQQAVKDGNKEKAQELAKQMGFPEMKMKGEGMKMRKMDWKKADSSENK